jgi:hypothetical protein
MESVSIRHGGNFVKHKNGSVVEVRRLRWPTPPPRSRSILEEIAVATAERLASLEKLLGWETPSTATRRKWDHAIAVRRAALARVSAEATS